MTKLILFSTLLLATGPVGAANRKECTAIVLDKIAVERLEAFQKRVDAFINETDARRSRMKAYNLCHAACPKYVKDGDNTVWNRCHENCDENFDVSDIIFE